MADNFLPYHVPSIGPQEIAAVSAALESHWITAGPRVQEFQKAFRAFVGSEHALAVDSCTAGLHVVLAALGIGPGDEVIVPDMTFCATANVVMHVQAKPVIADVTRDTYHIDPAAIERSITPKTKAIIPVHYGGQLCDMDAIMDIAQRHRLFVIEDSAHTIGVKYRGRMVGTIGNATVFSFYATKNLTTAEGGMITTDDDDLAEKIRILTLHGISKDAWKRYSAQGTWYYEVVAEGFKYNMTDLEAALGLVQLRRLPEFMARRRRLAERFNAGLKDVRGIRIPATLPYNDHGWHLYVVEINEQVCGVSRDRFIEAMREHGIGTSVHFIPLHRHPLYRNKLGVKPEQFQRSEEIYQRIVSLPLYPAMRDEDADRVISAVQETLGT